MKKIKWEDELLSQQLIKHFKGIQFDLNQFKHQHPCRKYFLR